MISENKSCSDPQITADTGKQLRVPRYYYYYGSNRVVVRGRVLDTRLAAAHSAALIPSI